MTILFWFFIINLAIVGAALAVKTFRRHAASRAVKTSPAVALSGSTAGGPWTIQNDILGIGKAGEDVRDFLESRDIPIKTVYDLTAILEEMLSFVLSSEFPDRRTHDIGIRVWIEKEEVHLELRYEGRGCNPLLAPAIDLAKPLAEITLDGMDIHLLRHWADRLDYGRDGRQCIFTAVKGLQPLM